MFSYHERWRPKLTTLLVVLSPLAAVAQHRFSEGPVQIHGFFSQGYAVSDQNNYLTMNTSKGTAQMTDGGVNLTWKINHKLRVGAQAYSRYIGEFGKGRVTLDWAVVDYRLKDWLGFRAGKVKTPLGLFNDAQDQEFLYTWALLPQAVYPLDLRDMTIAHVGGGIYGAIGMKRAGSLSYQVYAGSMPSDPRSGYVYGIEDSGFRNVRDSGRGTGYDLRWDTPLTGLSLGVSGMFQQRDLAGRLAAAPIAVSAKNYMNRRTAVYGQFSRGRWRFDGEWRHLKGLTRIYGLPPARSRAGQDTTGWFLALSCRISKRVEVGTYRSQYDYTPLFTPPVLLTGPGANHIYDTTATVRFDLARFWNFKIEGHFMDGFGNLLSFRGFYPRSHPQGLRPTTNLLVLRTGFTF